MGGVATIEEYEDSHYLLSQVVRSVEGFEGRHPLWVEHDPEGGCTLRLHLCDMKHCITGWAASRACPKPHPFWRLGLHKQALTVS